MSDDTPERPGGAAAFMRAVNVTRNAKLGFAIGTVLALALLALVARGPPGQFSIYLFVALAFVLAVATGLLLTAVFTVGSVIRRARELD